MMDGARPPHQPVYASDDGYHHEGFRPSPQQYMQDPYMQHGLE